MTIHAHVGPYLQFFLDVLNCQFGLQAKRIAAQVNVPSAVLVHGKIEIIAKPV
jgi:hypothetical protein